MAGRNISSRHACRTRAMAWHEENVEEMHLQTEGQGQHGERWQKERRSPPGNVLCRGSSSSHHTVFSNREW